VAVMPWRWRQNAAVKPVMPAPMMATDFISIKKS
jgi:hypothetical protein